MARRSSGPRFITDVFDGADKYPICQGSQTLDLMCGRIDAAGNVDIDPRTGRLYLTFSDNRNGTATDTNNDVFVTSSGNGGQTWSNPRNLTQGSVDDQWFPWLSVTQDGVVAVAYFDRRYSGPKLIDTSLSVSTNNGATFATRRVSELSWNPDLAFRQGVFIGDYNGLDARTGVAIPCWTDARFAEPNTPGNNPPNQQSDATDRRREDPHPINNEPSVGRHNMAAHRATADLAQHGIQHAVTGRATRGGRHQI